MKKLLLLFCLFAFATNSQAQLLKKLKEKAEKALEKKATSEKNKAENKVDNTIDNAIDNTVEGAKKVVTGGNKTNNQNTSDKSTPTEGTQNSDKKPATTSKPAATKPASLVVANGGKRKKMEAYKLRQISYFDDMTTTYNVPPLAWAPYIDKKGNKFGFVYVQVPGYVDYKVLNVYKVTPDGQTYLYIDGHNNSLDVLNSYDKRYSIPVFDAEGNIYFADNNYNLNKVWKITTEGKLLHIAGGKKIDGQYIVKDGQGEEAILDDARDFRVGKDGNIYFTDKILMDGRQLFSNPAIKKVEDRFKSYYVVVRKMTPNGNITTLHSSAGELVKFDVNATFETDSKGNVYFTRYPEGWKTDKADFCIYDAAKKEIRKLFATGQVSQGEDGSCSKLNWILGDASKAFIPQIEKIFSTSDGSLLLYSSAANKWVKYDGKTLSHFSGKTIPLKKGDCEVWNNVDEDGSATTASFSENSGFNFHQIGDDIYYSSFYFISGEDEKSVGNVYKLGKDGSKTLIHSYSGLPRTGYVKIK